MYLLLQQGYGYLTTTHFNYAIIFRVFLLRDGWLMPYFYFLFFASAEL